jgi:hypothetical protein
LNGDLFNVPLVKESWTRHDVRVWQTYQRGGMAEIEQGRRLSHLYITADTPLKDCKKARFRVSKLVEQSFSHSTVTGRSLSPDYAKRARNRLESELGIRFASQSTKGSFHEVWSWYFNGITIVEFLDSITVLVAQKRASHTGNADELITELRLIFRQQNLAYDIDDQGGIHPLVNGAFGMTKQSAIAALSGDRYTGTAELVNAIDKSLLLDPVNYIGAIRAVFGANENLFKLMFGVPRLDARTAGDKIGAKLQSRYDGHPTLQRASAKALEGFKDWIDAAHNYRHEQGVEAPSQPCEEIGILLISQGLSFVRWLAQLDRRD